MNDQHFEEVLETLPDTIGCMNVGYVNGQLLSKKDGRHKSPQPRELDGDYDDTDYLAPQNGGVLKPGMLLECAGFLDDNDVRQGIVLTNSGIKVKKRDSVRVTVAHHGWDAVDDKVVYHPSKTNGGSVGNVVQQLGEDIGLLDCTMPFVNEFPDLGIQAKSFLHSSQIKYNDTVVIDSCFTGVQKLRALGVRTGADRRLPTATMDGQSTPGPLPEHMYIKIVQGMYGVKSAVIPREAAIREGICGTPLILGGKNRREMATRLGAGIEVGFMLWNDIVGMYNS